MDSAPAAPASVDYNIDAQKSQVKDFDLSLSIGFVGIVIPTLFLMVRVYTRALLARMFSIDDLCMLLSWALAMSVQAILIYLRISKQIGVHLWDIEVHQANRTILVLEVVSIIYVPVVAFAKLSLLLLYRRLSRSRWLDVSIWITISIVIASSLAIILALIFACTPLERNWNITIREGSCNNKAAIYTASAIADAATDFVLLLLPIPVVLKLQLPVVQRIALLCMFVVGLITSTTSCVRLALPPPMLHDSDLTWRWSTPAILISVEASLVVVCGCLPSFQLFFRHMAPRWIGEPTTRDHPEGLNMTATTTTIATEPVFKSRSRPISELTLFKGRVRRVQPWERMPDSETIRSPASDVGLGTFDFQLQKSDMVHTKTSEIRTEIDPVEELGNTPWNCKRWSEGCRPP